MVINNFSNKENKSNKLKGDASYDSIPASKNIEYMKVDGGLIGWTLSKNKLKVGFYPYGDVNLDGAVSYKDSTTVLEMAGRLIKKPSKEFKLALIDMDGNKKIDAADAKKIYEIAGGDSELKDRYGYCVSTKKEYCNWNNEDTNAEKIYYLKKGTKYYINARKKKKEGYYSDEDKVYSSDVIKTNCSDKTQKNKWIVLSSPFGLSYSNEFSAYSNDGFSSIEYDTDLLRVRRIDNKKKEGYAKYRVYLKTKPINYRGKIRTAISIITKNGARDTTLATINTFVIPDHNTEYWNKKSVGTLPIYIDKKCKNSGTYIDAIKNLSVYVRDSVNYVEILNNKNYKSHSMTGNSAGEYWVDVNGGPKIVLNCESANQTNQLVYHEFGHAIDEFYSHYMGKQLSELSGFNKDYNISQKYKNKILTWNNGYAYKNRKEFFAQAFASYMLVKEDNYKHADLSKIGQTIYIKKVVDLNWRIKTESMSAYNNLYKTIFVD